MHKIMEEQGKELEVSLGKRREFMTFAANSSPVQNAVASSSKMPEVPVEPSLQEILTHAPSFKSMKEFDEYEKKRRTRSKKAKKAKNESVHLPVELRGTETTNIQVFPETKVSSEEPLDWGTPSAQDDESYDSLSEELAATAGISHLLLTPAPSLRLSQAPSTRSSKGKGKRKEKRFGEDNQDNNPDSHAYNDYGYNRLVSTNFTICTVTNDKKQQLLNSLSSIERRVELICNKCSSTTNCVRCKTRESQNKIEIMADSGASECFTHTQSDLSEFEVVNDKDLVVRTASKANSLKIRGKGAWIITHEVTHGGKK